MITAAVILIGDELLSGRTQDTNLNYIAKALRERGIVLTECRVVPDLEAILIEAVQALSARNTYVFTTGGIGSTHDDITSASVAKAFNQPLVVHSDALNLLEEYYGANLNQARRRMACAAAGAVLHARMVFQIANVFILAGIPKVMREMLDSLLPNLAQGEPILSITIKAYLLENDLADELSEIAHNNCEVSIGSYPFDEAGKIKGTCKKGTCLVATSLDQLKLAKAKDQLQALVDRKSALLTEDIL